MVGERTRTMTTPLPAAGSVRVISLRAQCNALATLLPGETVVRGDRSHPVLGNPNVFECPQSHEQRREVIAAFVAKAKADMAAGGPIAHEIDALAARVRAGERIALECWCKPLDCHLDWVADQVRERAYAGLSSADRYAAYEPYRMACEARTVLAMPMPERRAYIDRVKTRRGLQAGEALRIAVIEQDGLRDAAKTDADAVDERQMRMLG